MMLDSKAHGSISDSNQSARFHLKHYSVRYHWFEMADLILPTLRNTGPELLKGVARTIYGMYIYLAKKSQFSTPIGYICLARSPTKFDFEQHQRKNGCSETAANAATANWSGAVGGTTPREL